MDHSWETQRGFNEQLRGDLAAGEILDSGKRIKLELETPLEKGLLYGSVCGGLFTLFALFDILKEKPFGWTMFGPCAVIGAVSFFCYRNCDNFYVIDLPRRALMYRFKFFFYEDYRQVASFAQIAAVTTDGVKESSKSSSWWEYRTMVGLKDGRMIPVSDSFREDLGKAEDLARKLAAVFQAEFVPGQAECHAKAVLGEGGLFTLCQAPPQTLPTWLAVFIIVAFLIAILLVAAS